MARQKGREPLPFLEALQAEPERARTLPAHVAKRFAYVDRSFYARQLGRLWRYFPREQTIVFKSEELSEAYEDVLDRIAGFLGIGPFPRIAPKTIHARDYEATMSEAEREYLKTVLEPDVRDLERLLGWDCSSWLA